MTGATVQRLAFLKDFTCLGAECADTCCKGWAMQVDEPTYARYAGIGPALTDAVSGAADARVMKRDARTDYCVKFEGGLCGIQKQHGESFLSDACHFYPRMTRALGDSVTMTAALSCPEIARLALFSKDGFAPETTQIDRLPGSLHDYLQQGMKGEETLAIHAAFLRAALEESRTPERNCMHIIASAESLARISFASWPEGAVFHLEHAGARLPAPQPKDTDPFYLLQALCGITAAAKKLNQERLMQTIHTIEQALHCTIRWDNLAIAHLPDSAHAARAVSKDWQERWGAHYAPLLRRYLAAQISLAMFPFGGFGDTLPHRAAIIGVRFATVRLALMCAAHVLGAALPEADCVRIVQSLSRLLDHLSDPEFSLKIYQETGWTSLPRLRAVVGDG